MNALPLHESHAREETPRLQSLPSEVLINIFSYLDDRDLYCLQSLCSYFRSVVNDEELWKNLFLSHLQTSSFPSVSRSQKYSTEFVERRRALQQWKHNRAVRTKYVISPARFVEQRIEHIVFDYPRCACYIDGIITLVQLHSRRAKNRLLYIPCTTPHGCSTMDFNMTNAVFGRFDGRLYGKLLSNRSYLTPVMEFNDSHSTSVTAIATSNSVDSNLDWCVSGCESGEVKWWCEAKHVKTWRISNKPILKLSLCKEWTLIMDEDTIYIVNKLSELHTIPLPTIINSGSEDVTQIHFVKFDFGSQRVVLGTNTTLFVISFDFLSPHFGKVRSLSFQEDHIQEISIDEDTSRREREQNLAGGDGCYVALLLESNTIAIVNTRNESLRIQSKILFEDKVYTCQVNNLVIVVALDGYLQILNAGDGSLIKTIQKTEKLPQFLKISNGSMIVSSGNVLQYLHYLLDKDQKSENSRSARNESSRKIRSNKWNETLNSELTYYNEELDLDERRAQESQRLREAYGGDLDDEELQLRIALMESATTSAGTIEAETPDRIAWNCDGRDFDEELRRAIEESQRLHDTERRDQMSDQEDPDLLRIIEESRLEQERFESEQRRRNQRRNSPLGQFSDEFRGTDENEALAANHALTDDEDLQLALAISLSDLN